MNRRRALWAESISHVPAAYLTLTSLAGKREFDSRGLKEK